MGVVVVIRVVVVSQTLNRAGRAPRGSDPLCSITYIHIHTRNRAGTTSEDVLPARVCACTRSSSTYEEVVRSSSS
jgi:hypothetical protein